LSPTAAAAAAAASTNATAASTSKKSHDTAFVVTKSHKDTSSNKDDEKEVETCTICWEALNVDDAAAKVVQIRSCLHLFHADCFNASIQHDTKCPVCRAPICAEPIGHSPSGTMQISLLNQPCPGFNCDSTWQLDYHLPSGHCQYPYHENPGHSYSGAHRTAFLPNAPLGRELLARLQYAWMHGLLFRVGTSVTTGVSNTVVWSSIHHKTSLDGGAHGFPDDSYLANCHEALDQVHVPPAGQCGVYDNVTEMRTARSTWTYTAPPTLAGSVALQQAIQDVHSSKTSTTTTTTATTTTTKTKTKTTAGRNKKSNASAAAVVPLATPSVGKCPSGTMTINVLPDVICPGFNDDTATIEIVYTIPNGIQHTFHENPGVPYAGTIRTTYLPNTEAGRDLLWRLRYAWRHGLVFDVGTSLTTGATNVVVWSTAIAHKTRLSANTGRSTRRSARAASAADPFAFPDPAYIDHCHGQLDALHVPDARTLSMGAQF
jgi:Deltex C-terminal domain/Ring finger domain